MRLTSLFDLELDHLDFRAGLGFALSFIAVLLLASFGPWVIVSGLAVMLLWLGDFPGPVSQRIAAVGAFGAGSIALSLLAAPIDGRLLPNMILIFTVGVAGALAAGWGDRARVTGWLLIFWTVLAQAIVGELDSGGIAIGLAVGTVIVAIVIGLAAWLRGGTSAREESDSPTDDGQALDLSYALIVGAILAVTTLLGTVWLSTTPAWMSITALVVIGPDLRQVWMRSVQRALGSLLGLEAGSFLGSLIPTTEGLVLGAALAAFLLLSLAHVNYLLMALSLTIFLSLTWRLGSPGYAEAATTDRFVAEMCGIAIALLAVLIHSRARRTSGRAADGG